MGNLFFLILILIGLLAILWFIFYKTFLWTINPLIKHFDEKDKEQKEMHDAIMDIRDRLDKDKS